MRKFEHAVSNYYVSGGLEVNPRDNLVIATVKGIGKTSNYVTIKLTQHNTIEEFTCTCSSRDYCPHVITVYADYVYTHVKPGENKKTQAQREFRIPDGEIGLEDLPFSMHENDDRLKAMLLDPEMTEKKSQDDKIQIALGLKYGQWGNSQKITYSLQFLIREKEHSWNRGIIITQKNISRFTFSLDTTEQMLFPRILAAGGKADLFEIFPYLLEAGIQKIFSFEDENFYAMKKVSSIGLDFDFFLDEDSMMQAETVFRSRLDNDASYTVRYTGGTFRHGISGDFLVFIPYKENTIYYYFCKDASILLVLSELMEDQGIRSKRELETIQNWVKKHKSNALILDYKPMKYKMEIGTPKVIIELFEGNESDYMGMVGVRLIFSYDGHEVAAMDEETRNFFRKEKAKGKKVTGIITLRDFEFEKKIFDHYWNKVGNDRDMLYGPNQRKFFDYVSAAIFLANFGEEILSSGHYIRIHKKPSAVKRVHLSYNVHYDKNWFSVNVSGKDQEEKKISAEEIKTILNGIEEHNLDYDSIVTTKSGWMILSKEDINFLRKYIGNSVRTPEGFQVHEGHFASLEEISQKPGITFPSQLMDRLRIYEKLKNFQTIEKIPPPKIANTTLRRYQQEGLNWLNFLREYGLGGILADDMGLGKTLQMLSLLKVLQDKGQLGTSVIVLPLSTMFNWQNEIEKFTPSLKGFSYHGHQRKKSNDYFSNYDLILVSYQTLRMDADIFQTFNFDFLIMDESQYVKNAHTKAYRAVMDIPASHRISLTGTPVENNIFELWAQMNLVNRGILGPLNWFRKVYGTPIQKYQNGSKTRELQKIIHPFLLRRKKEDVARDLPAKEEINIYSEMEEQQRKIYLAYSGKYYEDLSKKMEEKMGPQLLAGILEALLRTRQIAVHPGLVDDQYLSVPSGKFNRMMEMLEEAVTENHKLLVFSQFVKMLKITEKALAERGISYAYLDGSLSPQKRKMAIANFQQDKNLQVFLISLKAGGVGINLTEADYVFILDPWWNPAVENQAIDRTHRIGQEKNVFAYRFITKDSVEEKIMELQKDKMELYKTFISSGESFLKKLTREEILSLFKNPE